MNFYDIADTLLAIISSLAFLAIILGAFGLALHTDTLKEL